MKRQDFKKVLKISFVLTISEWKQNIKYLNCLVFFEKEVNNMAKPIRATPTLKGDDAINFIKAVIKEEKRPSKNRISLIKEASRIKFNCC